MFFLLADGTGTPDWTFWGNVTGWALIAYLIVYQLPHAVKAAIVIFNDTVQTFKDEQKAEREAHTEEMKAERVQCQMQFKELMDTFSGRLDSLALGLGEVKGVIIKADKVVTVTSKNGGA